MPTDAITLFKQAAAQLQQEEAYLYYAHARQQNDEDEALQQCIGQFNLLRQQLTQAAQNGEDEDRQKILDQQLREAYGQVMANPSMQRYNEAKQAMDTVLGYISAIIDAACAGEDPMLVEEPHGCTGQCAGCAGGCHS